MAAGTKVCPPETDKLSNQMAKMKQNVSPELLTSLNFCEKKTCHYRLMFLMKSHF